jgi:hypothetical protein
MGSNPVDTKMFVRVSLYCLVVTGLAQRRTTGGLLATCGPRNLKPGLRNYLLFNSYYKLFYFIYTERFDIIL